MPRVGLDIMVHYLNVRAECRLVKKKKRELYTGKVRSSKGGDPKVELGRIHK